MTAWMNRMYELVIANPMVLRILGAVLLFVLGWITARLAAAIFFRTLRRLDLDGRIARRLDIPSLRRQQEADPDRFERIASKIFYYVLLIFLVVLILDYFGLAVASDPLKRMLTEVTAAVPEVLQAALILFVATVGGHLLRLVVRRLVGSVKLDAAVNRLSGEEISEEDAKKQSELTARIFGDAVFYFVLLLGIAPALGALGLAELASPLRSILDDLFEVVPKAIGAALTVLVGWIVARIARRGLATLLSSVGFDQGAEKLGIKTFFRDKPASWLVGSLAYWLILIPVAASGVEMLEIRGLSGPINAALTRVMALVPDIFAGVGVLFVAVIAGRWVGKLVEGLAESLGVDSFLPSLGIGKLEAKLEGRAAPSDILGRIAQVIVLLFGILQGLEIIGLDRLANLLQNVIDFLPGVALAIVIVGFGFFLGTFVQGVVDEYVEQSGNEFPGFLGAAAKVTVVVFAALIATQQVGLAEELVRSAFEILFGAVCFALALAFGLGAKDSAGEIVREQVGKMRRAKTNAPADAATAPRGEGEPTG